jgi:hypothetical protein
VPLERMPTQWIMAAARLPGRTLHLALALQVLASANSSCKVELSNVASLQFGLDRNAKYRALAWLERAGLVRVERKVGRSPIVALLRHSGADA